MAKPNQGACLRLYKRYEYLARVYANKLYNCEHLGMTQDDVIQEFKTKIWYSVIKFAKRWSSYRKTGKFKPIPLPFFIKSNLNSLIIDLSKKINGYYVDVNGQKVERVKGFTSIESAGFDIGREPDVNTCIDFIDQRVIVHGVDILGGLNKKEGHAFIMHLKGYPTTLIRKVHRDIDVTALIARQTASLREHSQELLGEESRTFMAFQPVDAEA